MTALPRTTVVLLAVGLSSLAPAAAFARSTEQPTGTPAPANAFEITAGTGYTQGFGMLRRGLSVPDVVTPGIGLDLGLGYRIDPRWAVAWSFQYQALTPERAASARGFTTSIAAQYHLAPSRSVDPWVEVGGGYRYLFEGATVGPSFDTHGFQLARVKLGLDFRPAERIAVGPVVGADLNLFVFQNLPNLTTSISDPRVSTFVFAGIQGRFDIGGSSKE